MKSKIKLSIIIANYNSEKFINRCLVSILDNTKTPFEIIIVDDNSNDNSPALVQNLAKKDSHILFFQFKKRVGPSRLRNFGAEKSSGQYLLFLDNDTYVPNNWIDNVIEYLDVHKKVGAGFLKIMQMANKKNFDSAGEKITSFGFLAERAQGTEDNGQFDKVEPIFSGKGAAMIVHCNIFKKIGGFDGDYFMYWEEPDLTWRIWKTGFRLVFLPIGKVYHAYNTPQKKISNTWKTQITYLGCRNQITTMIKNGVGLQGFRMFMTVSLAWLGFLFLFFLKGNFQKAGAIFKAFIWLIRNIKVLHTKRVKLKRKLGKDFYSDPRWLPLIIDKRSFRWYLGKTTAYLLGKPY